MSLATNISSGLTELATAIKTLRSMVTGTTTGTLAGLSTTDKSSIVAALNELDGEIAALSAGAAGINDAVTATDSTWSSSKTASEIADADVALKNDILGGAGAAYDTLQELKALLDASDSEDDAAISAINTALGFRLRFDSAQTLTSPQQAQGQANLSVYSRAEIGDPTTDFVAVVQAGLA